MLIGKDDADYVDAYHTSGAADSRISLTSGVLGRLGVSKPLGNWVILITEQRSNRY